jgi:hypothetical protein
MVMLMPMLMPMLMLMLCVESALRRRARPTQTDQPRGLQSEASQSMLPIAVLHQAILFQALPLLHLHRPRTLISRSRTTLNGIPLTRRTSLLLRKITKVNPAWTSKALGSVCCITRASPCRGS